jgi:hypothetical protein
MVDVIVNFIALMVMVLIIRKIILMYSFQITKGTSKTISGFQKSKRIVNLIAQLVENESLLKVSNEVDLRGGVMFSLFGYNVEVQESLFLNLWLCGKVIGRIQLLIKNDGDITIGMIGIDNDKGQTDVQFGSKLYALILDLIMKELPEHKIGTIEEHFYNRGKNLLLKR